MARMNFNGASDLLSALEKTGNSIRPATGKALYHGAGIVVEEIRKSIESMKEPTDADNMHGIKPERKKGLLDGLGIAGIERKDGRATEKVGFEGYNSICYAKHPNGEPNIMVARAIEHGRSGSNPSKKHPFVRPAARRARKSAEAKMAEVIEAEINKVL